MKPADDDMRCACAGCAVGASFLRESGCGGGLSVVRRKAEVGRWGLESRPGEFGFF